MPNPVVAKVQIAAGGGRHPGWTERSFSTGRGEARGVLGRVSPIFVGSWLFTNGEISRQGYTHFCPFEGVRRPRGLSAAPHSAGLFEGRREGGRAAGAPPAGGVRPRSAADSGLPGAAGALTAPHSGSGGNGGGARIRTPARASRRRRQQRVKLSAARC